MSARQHTICGVPESVDLRLRQIALAEGKSLNTVLLESLEHGLGMSDQKPIHHDLDAFYGQWEHDEKFDQAIKDLDPIDAELWK